ncbi:MAG: signal peptidase I [Oscillospiraceae bacterium]|jgi:signal peptidase I|nr:signal peptidase I [Oscillospiraceae bacterium]
MTGGKANVARAIHDWAQSLVGAIVGITLVFVFIAGEFSVRESSMENSLLAYDRLIVSNLFYTPQRGDIVLFAEYGLEDSYDPDTGKYTPFVKRVIGLPNDELQFVNGKLYINEVLQDESGYLKERKWIWRGGMPETFTVPPGQYFLMGDNRNASHDSRSVEIGFVDRRSLLGRVLFRILPLNRIGTV